MIYAHIAIFIAVFGAGFWAGDKFESTNTTRLELLKKKPPTIQDLIDSQGLPESLPSMPKPVGSL